MISYPFIACVLFTCCLIVTLTNADRQPGQCCDEYCYDTDSEKPQSSRFATKSAYQIIKGSDSRRQFVVPSKLWEKAVNSKRSGNVVYLQIVIPSNFGLLVDMERVYPALILSQI